MLVFTPISVVPQLKGMPCLVAEAQSQHSQVSALPVCIIGMSPCRVAWICKLSQAELADVSVPLLVQKAVTVQPWECRKSWLPVKETALFAEEPQSLWPMQATSIASLQTTQPCPQQALQSCTTQSLPQILSAATIFYKIRHENTSCFYCMLHPYIYSTFQTQLMNSLRPFCKNTLEILLSVSYIEQTCLAQTMSTLRSFVRYYCFH